MPITLHPQRLIIRVWRFAAVVAAALPAFFAPLFLRPGSGLWATATGLWAGVFLFFYLYYLPAHCKGLSLTAKEDEIILKTGVFSRVTHRMPINAIQYITLRSSPLHRRRDLATLVIYAPGVRLVMPGLSRAQAMRIMELGVKN